jgi:hypothetical protein
LAASTGLGGTGTGGTLGAALGGVLGGVLGGMLGVVLGVFSAISVIHGRVTGSGCQTLICVTLQFSIFQTKPLKEARG